GSASVGPESKCAFLCPVCGEPNCCYLGDLKGQVEKQNLKQLWKGSYGTRPTALILLLIRCIGVKKVTCRRGMLVNPKTSKQFVAALTPLFGMEFILATALLYGAVAAGPLQVGGLPVTRNLTPPPARSAVQNEAKAAAPAGAGFRQISGWPGPKGGLHFRRSKTPSIMSP